MSTSTSTAWQPHAVGERVRQKALARFRAPARTCPAWHSRARPTPPPRSRAASGRSPARRRSRRGRRAVRGRPALASRRCAATLSAFSRTATAAMCTAEPAVTVCRLAKPPWPYGMTAVSPATTRDAVRRNAELLGADLRQRGPDALAPSASRRCRPRCGRSGRCARCRIRTARGRCPSRRCRCRCRDSGPARARARWRSGKPA